MVLGVDNNPKMWFNRVIAKAISIETKGKSK